MFKTRLVVLMVLLAAVVATPVQAVFPAVPHDLDNMDNIALRPWTDLRDPQEGTGWLSQGGGPFSGAMKIDYGVTNDSAGVPNPASGYDYLGAWVGVGGTGGAFDVAGTYLGKMDREISGPFTLGNNARQMPNLLPVVSTHRLTMDVYKSVAGYSEHVREIQLYDSTGARNTYSVQPEATADATPQGWSFYQVPLSTPLENNADMTDIVDVRFFVTAWSAYVFQNFESPVWPDDYMLVPQSGTPVYIDNLELVPEPATIAMLSLGGLALLRRRKKA